MSILHLTRWPLAVYPQCPVFVVLTLRIYAHTVHISCSLAILSHRSAVNLCSVTHRSAVQHGVKVFVRFLWKILVFRFWQWFFCDRILVPTKICWWCPDLVVVTLLTGESCNNVRYSAVALREIIWNSSRSKTEQSAQICNASNLIGDRDTLTVSKGDFIIVRHRDDWDMLMMQWCSIIVIPYKENSA